jgi:hypothetical protein
MQSVCPSQGISPDPRTGRGMSRIAWTGHRPDVFRDADAARNTVERAAHDLLHAGGVSAFLVGGQRGVDTWAAQAAVDLGVPFSLILPLSVDAFTSDWQANDRAQLQDHVRHAREVRIAGGYSERNRLLAVSADLLVAVWAGVQGGGTAETIAFAEQHGTPVREVLLDAADGVATLHGRGI